VTTAQVLVVADEPLGRYGFPNGHPFGTDRLAAFLREFRGRGQDQRCLAGESRIASDLELSRFHTPAYVQRVHAASLTGQGFLDQGDTPAFVGCFEAASRVVGATLDAGAALMRGDAQRAFVPIAGLHHAARDSAAGFCIFNDCGVLIETLRQDWSLQRIAYVDIDAHHGDGVFYAFAEDPGVIFADIHEDGRFLYPGTGAPEEIGEGLASGTKLNIALAPGADDAEFLAQWPQVLAHLKRLEPQFIILQCGTDSMGGDPITHLQLTTASHERATADLAALADSLGHGRLLALGGGGYNRANIASGWSAVVEALLKS
jgi:acetoin utilization protein AcuC